jgi:quercetin dioxygenase-like cupin family protein
MPYARLMRWAGLALLLAAPMTGAEAQMPVHTDLRPKVVRYADGEHRYLADGRFMLLKVGPVATGASYLFMGYEDLPPGTAIPKHEHEVDEEILIVYRGRVRVTFDKDSAEASAGDAIFLPPKSPVGLRAIGTDTASIFFVFPRGSVERCFQGTGRDQPGAPARVFSDSEMAEGRRVCQMTYF